MNRETKIRRLLLEYFLDSNNKLLKYILEIKEQNIYQSIITCINT